MVRPPPHNDYGGDGYYEETGYEGQNYSEQMEDRDMHSEEMHTEAGGNPKPLMAIRTPADIKAEVAANAAADDPKTAMRSGSKRYFFACAFSQRMAALQSWICAGQLASPVSR